MRIGPDGRRSARASSHHGYVYDAGGPALIPGYVSRPAPGGGVVIERRPVTVNDWGPDTGVVYVAGGSHAGRAGVPQGDARIDQVADGCGSSRCATIAASEQRRSSQSCLRGSRRSSLRPGERRRRTRPGGDADAPPPVKSQTRYSTSTMINRIPTIVQTVLLPIGALLP